MNGECPRWRSDPGGPLSASEPAVVVADYSSLNLLRARLPAAAALSLSLCRGCCPEMRYVCSLKMGAIVFDYWSLPPTLPPSRTNEYCLLLRPRNASPISPPLLNCRNASRKVNCPSNNTSLENFVVMVKYTDFNFGERASPSPSPSIELAYWL